MSTLYSSWRRMGWGSTPGLSNALAVPQLWFPNGYIMFLKRQYVLKGVGHKDLLERSGVTNLKRNNLSDFYLWIVRDKFIKISEDMERSFPPCPAWVRIHKMSPEPVRYIEICTMWLLFWLQLFEGKVKLLYDVKQMTIGLFLLLICTENVIVHGV